jgi:hypothetical protein
MSQHCELTEWISSLSARWLSHSTTTATLQDALDDSVAEARPQTLVAKTAGPVLFPVLYYSRPRVTSTLFHQIIDACQEAERTFRRVRLVGVAVGRADPAADSSGDLAAICEALNDEGWPVEFRGDVSGIDGGGSYLASRARRASYTRRSKDLPDLLVAAACDAVGASAVYLSDGVTGGRSIGRLSGIAPLGRLHVADDPFAPPPAEAKLRPAGYDQVWGAAYTLGETDAATISDETRREVSDRVRQRLERTWRVLRRVGLTAHRGISSADARRVVTSGTPRASVTVPLFGARTISASTSSLVKIVAMLAEATLVVDDITPSLLYRDADLNAIRAGFEQLVAGSGAQVSFLSQLDRGLLYERIRETLELLTIADLVAASPHGKAGRSRAAFTGYDAIHLALMAVACGLRSDTAVAVQAANVPAVRSMTRLHRADSLIVRSGPAGPVGEHEFRLSADWLSLPRLAFGGRQ